MSHVLKKLAKDMLQTTKTGCGKEPQEEKQAGDGGKEKPQDAGVQEGCVQCRLQQKGNHTSGKRKHRKDQTKQNSPGPAQMGVVIDEHGSGH